MVEKMLKPLIEDIIEEVLSGKEKENANNFVSFLKSKKLKPVYNSQNAWKVNYKGKGLCYIRLYGTAPYHKMTENSWHINFIDFSGINLQNITTDFKEIVWENTKFCFSCSKCPPGFKINIPGKELNNVCHNWFIMTKPSLSTLDYSKKIIDLSIDNN